MHPPDPLPTWDDIVAIAADHGIARLGITPAAELVRARAALVERKAAGLHAGMAFTYRNPDRSTDPFRALPGARSIIVAARPYRAVDEPPAPAGPHGRVARYSWVDHYEPLRVGLRAIVAPIKAAGHRAVAYADDNSIVDREVAYLGGLGWFGKNANLLLPGAGSYFVLGSVITTADYTTTDVTTADHTTADRTTADRTTADRTTADRTTADDTTAPPVGEPVADGCGTCTRCIDACPTGAIVGPGVVDARRCLAWLVQAPGEFPAEHRVALGDRLYGCDDCQEVCPPTVRLGDRHRVGLAEPAEAWVDVLDLLVATDDELLARHGRWYIAGRDPRWLRRNALIVLGNTADPADAMTSATLARYRADPDPILREHAGWATARLAERVHRP